MEQCIYSNLQCKIYKTFYNKKIMQVNCKPNSELSTKQSIIHMEVIKIEPRVSGVEGE